MKDPDTMKLSRPVSADKGGSVWQWKSAVVVLPDSLTVRELADSIEISVIEVMKVLIANGIVASINQQIDFDTASIVCSEFDIEALSQSSLAELAENGRSGPGAAMAPDLH